MLKKILPMAALALLMTGCQATWTNLTPRQQVRSEDGLYPVEFQMNTRQGTIKWDTIEARLMVGTNLYPMQQTVMISNRWEGFVPVSAETNEAFYRYRLDFLYDAWGGPQRDSMLSEDYRLLILDE